MGHEIDSTGITFSREKLSEVGDFPLPKTAKTLRSFLGLANYFRRHIDKYAIMELPMRGVLTRYDKSRKFEWTPEAEEAFQAMQIAIRNRPKLYFPSQEGRIRLHTDASDYGIGAYLFQ